MKKKKLKQNKLKQSGLGSKCPKKVKASSSGDKMHIIRSKTKVQLQESLAKNPWCAHGPTILFERVSTDLGDNKNKNFYACSAYRDRKECVAYFQADDNNLCIVSEEKMFKWKQILKRDSHGSRPQNQESLISFCKDCSEVVMKESISHKDHKVIKLKEKELSQPTLSGLLISKHTSTKEAQYHFSKDTLDVLLNQFIFKSNENIRVVCVGTPRIHETIISTKSKKAEYNVQSILLDIDERLGPIYDSCQSTWGTFCHYNMFNHFFFREIEQKDYLKFIGGNDHIIIVTDPPFGGKCELIGRTMRLIKEDILHVRNKEPVADYMWIFPYYMERQIQYEIPGIRMSDFQVCYETKDKNGYKDGLETGNSGCRKV